MDFHKILGGTDCGTGNNGLNFEMICAMFLKQKCKADQTTPNCVAEQRDLLYCGDGSDSSAILPHHTPHLPL